MCGRVRVVVVYASTLVRARGGERFADALLQAAGSGLIVPDLPIEEGLELLGVCDERGLALVPLDAPTTPDERLARIGASARGFLYAASLTGTMGERASFDGSVATVLAWAAAHTDVPV